MKKIQIISFIILLYCGSAINAQNATWMKGSAALNTAGKYGSLGVSSNTNNPGGREFAATWQDAAGNLWLFGGLGIDAQGNEDLMNDLWKFNPNNNQWTWIKGDSVIAAIGIYGTQGIPSSTTTPGARAGACTWQDASGNFWLFGGEGYDAFNNQAELGDLWKYNPSTNQWTWMKGSNAAMASGVYGTMGQSASANLPGARYGSYAWKDATGNFWLFGGTGYDASTTSSYLNDLWKYNPQNNQWTWVNGSNITDQYGVYGVKGVASSTTSPGGRFFGRAIVDASGNFWLFGGVGFATSGLDDVLNDLWKYNQNSNQWTWVSGSNLVNQIGKYGIAGISSSTNTPGARAQPLIWLDGNNNIMLFGGYGNALNNSNQGNLSDYWSFSAVSGNWTWLKGPNAINAKANYGTQGVLAASNKMGSAFDAMTWQTNANTLWVFGGFGFNASSTIDGYLNDVWKISPCQQQSLNISPSSSPLCLNETCTLTATGASSFVWSNGQTGNVIVVSPTTSSTYSVSSTEPLFCNNTVGIIVTVNACTDLKSVSNINVELLVYPNPNNGHFSVNTNVPGAQLSIFNAIGQVVYQFEVNDESINIDSKLPTGVYFYQLQKDKQVLKKGKLLLHD